MVLSAGIESETFHFVYRIVLTREDMKMLQATTLKCLMDVASLTEHYQHKHAKYTSSNGSPPISMCVLDKPLLQHRGKYS